MDSNQRIIIVGGGPAGLFCAYLLLGKGCSVDLYDHSSGLAKKFLIAGNGGLNLTHSEDLDSFALKYGKEAKRFRELLDGFSPTDLRGWCKELGIETFVGSSGRVFPTKLKSGEILVKWVQKLKSYKNFNLYLKHKIIRMTEGKELTFENAGSEVIVKAETVILALGGASWKETGSDGLWKNVLGPLGIKINKFLPMNCGFERLWSDFFKKNVDRTCLKYVEVSFQGKSVKGDLMLTPYGIEGGVIYALSNLIRNELVNKESTTILVDLRPDLSIEALIQKLGRKTKKMTLSNHLRKTLNFDKCTFILLKELLAPSDFETMESLAKKIKHLEIELEKTRPINEAISTSGGVCFSQLSQFMELKAIPGLYFSGEMLDYEAPTGGYLLQACFSTAWKVSKGIVNSNKTIKTI